MVAANVAVAAKTAGPETTAAELLGGGSVAPLGLPAITDAEAAVFGNAGRIKPVAGWGRPGSAIGMSSLPFTVQMMATLEAPGEVDGGGLGSIFGRRKDSQNS